MQFSIQAVKLAAALKPVTALINNKGILPVLQCVRLEIGSNNLSMMGTNLDAQIRLTLPDIAVQETGIALVDAAKFRSVVSALPGTAEITCQVKAPDPENFNLRKLEVKMGRSRYQFDSLSLDDFPDFAQPESDDNPVTMVLTRTELLGMIQEVSAAMAKQDVRYYLEGILFESKDGILSLVATDGHRMSVSHMDAPSPEPFTAIVSGDTIKAIQGLPLSDSFNLSFYSNQVLLSNEQLTFSAKLIDGRYPDWRRVLPNEDDYQRLSFEAKPFTDAVNRLSVVTAQNPKGFKKPLRMKLVNTDDKKELELSVGEDGCEIISLIHLEATNDFEVGLNIDYLVDALKPVDTDGVTMSLRDGNAAVVVRYKDDQVSILMPLRL